MTTHDDLHFAYTALHADLAICGCGYSDELLAEVLKVLDACPLHEGRWEPDDRFGIYGAELLLHVMTEADLLEHGSVVSGSWLTEKGKRLRDIMRDVPLEALENVGISCSDCPEWDSNR